MKKSYIFAILAAVLVTASLVIAGVLVGSKLSSHSGASASPAVTTGAITDTSGKQKAGSSDDSIAIPGFEKMVMKAGQTKQTIKLYNPETNSCYFQIYITLADGTELFHSGMIKPGQTIDSIEISRSLKAGDYKDAVLRYDCYALEGLQPLNGAQTVFDLEVIQ